MDDIGIIFCVLNPGNLKLNFEVTNLSLPKKENKRRAIMRIKTVKTEMHQAR